MLQLAGGVCLAVDIGYFLQLERAFGGGDGVCSASDKEDIVVSIQLLRKRIDLIAACDYSGNVSRQCGGDLTAKRTGAICVYLAAKISELYCKHGEHRDLRGVAFGGGDGNLRSCACVHYRVGFARYCRADHIDYSQRGKPALMCKPERLKGVGRFAGLRNRYRYRVSDGHGRSIAVFGCKVDGYGDPRKPLYQHTTYKSRVHG